jgi:hypothetical protein
MRRRGLIPILLPVLAAVAGCWRPAVRLPAGESGVAVPLERAGEVLLVPVQINGRDAGRFLVDTGAEGNLIDREVAAELGLPWVWQLKAVGVGGSRPLPVRRVSSMSLGGVALQSHVLGELDFAPVSDGLRVRIGGCLGAASLSRVPVTLDFREATLTFHDPVQFRPPPGAQEHPMRVLDGQPFVRGVVNERHKGWFLLDTGYTGAVELTPGFTRRHPELLPTDDARSHTVVGVAGQVRRVRGRIESFALLGHDLGSVEADFLVPGEVEGATSGELGTVSAGILRNFRLTFDFPGRRVWAEWVGWETVAEMVARGVDLDEPDARGWRRLHDGARDGEAARVTALLAAGAKVDPLTPEGNTPLLLAAGQGHAGIVADLLAGGADTSKRNRHGATALWVAARRDHEAVVARLIAAGASVEARHNRGWTPLLTAASDGRTPLMAAGNAGDREAVEALLAAGADVSARDADGWTAADYARGAGHTELAGRLAGGAARGVAQPG